MSKSSKKKKSSLELGIIKKLKEEEGFIEWIIAEYVVGVNSKWHSYDFPSSQLAKMVLKILIRPNTKFSITHKIIKEILKKWENNEICLYITTTKYAHCRGKTKIIYRFTDSGIKKIKELIIEMVIISIKKEDTLLLKLSDQRTMKTREKIIDDFLLEYQEKIGYLISTQELNENE